MPQRLKIVLSAICAILGSIVLVVSFQINPAPPANDTIAQLIDFTDQHRLSIILGGWLQAVGSILTVLFALSVVYFAKATSRLSGLITILAAISILTVSLLEVTFYLTATQAMLEGDSTTGAIANAVIKSVQHIFLISPALLLPLGYVLITYKALPRSLGALSMLIGAVLQVLGPIGLFRLVQPLVDIVLIVQAIWFVAAGVIFLIKIRRIEVAFAELESL